MGRRIGVVAGLGGFVSLAVSGMSQRGFSCIVAGIKGEADPRLRKQADVFEWVKLGEAAKAVSFFKKHGVGEVLLLGKVRHSSIFRRKNSDDSGRLLLEGTKDRSPMGLLNAVVEFLKAEGLEVVSPFSILQPFFCQEGVLTRVKPSPDLAADIDFGLRMARRLADLDIGQTLIVKEGAVVAVEGMEGTDQTIRRGGRFAGNGFAAVKAARTAQDIRLDVPAVGLDTVRSLVKARAGALGIEASRVAFFQKEEAVALADSAGLAIVVRALPGAWREG